MAHYTSGTEAIPRSLAQGGWIPTLWIFLSTHKLGWLCLLVWCDVHHTVSTLHWWACFCKTGSRANKDWEITMQLASESSSKFTSVPATFKEMCQSSWVRHSLLVLKENVRKPALLSLPCDSTKVSTIFLPKSCIIFLQAFVKCSFSGSICIFCQKQERSPLVRRTTKFTFLLPWIRTWCLSMPQIFTVLLFCAHHFYLFFRSIRRPCHRNRFFHCKLISSLNS